VNCGIETDSRKLDSRVGARRIYSTAPGHFGIYSESVEPWRSLNDARAWLDMSLGLFEVFLNPCSWGVKFYLGGHF
jgi:hypothetical protein